MEGKTPAEKIHSLDNLVTSLAERMTTLDAAIKAVESDHSRTADAFKELKDIFIRMHEQVAELKRWKEELGSTDLKTDLAILKRDVAKLEAIKEEWSRRIWAMAGPILGAAVGWALGYFSRR